jgi:hypothetical protein
LNTELRDTPDSGASMNSWTHLKNHEGQDAAGAVILNLMSTSSIQREALILPQKRQIENLKPALA